MRTTMADSDSTHRTIDPFSREVLEFPAVLELLHRYLSGPISEPLLEQVEPHTRLWRRFGAIWNWRARRASTCARARGPAWRGCASPARCSKNCAWKGWRWRRSEIMALVELARAGLDMYRTFAQASAPRPSRGWGAERSTYRSLGQRRRRPRHGEGAGRTPPAEPARPNGAVGHAAPGGTGALAAGFPQPGHGTGRQDQSRRHRGLLRQRGIGARSPGHRTGQGWKSSRAWNACCGAFPRITCCRTPW